MIVSVAGVIWSDFSHHSDFHAHLNDQSWVHRSPHSFYLSRTNFCGDVCEHQCPRCNGPVMAQEHQDPHLPEWVRIPNLWKDPKNPHRGCNLRKVPSLTGGAMKVKQRTVKGVTYIYYRRLGRQIENSRQAAIPRPAERSARSLARGSATSNWSRTETARDATSKRSLPFPLRACQAHSRLRLERFQEQPGGG